MHGFPTAEEREAHRADVVAQAMLRAYEKYVTEKGTRTKPAEAFSAAWDAALEWVRGLGEQALKDLDAEQAEQAEGS